MYGKYILLGISKGTFEIPHKISYTFIEIFYFYTNGNLRAIITCIGNFLTDTTETP